MSKSWFIVMHHMIKATMVILWTAPISSSSRTEGSTPSQITCTVELLKATSRTNQVSVELLSSHLSDIIKNGGINTESDYPYSGIVKGNVEDKSSLCGIAVEPFIRSRHAPHKHHLLLHLRLSRILLRMRLSDRAMCCDDHYSCCPYDYPICNIYVGTYSIGKDNPFGAEKSSS